MGGSLVFFFFFCFGVGVVVFFNDGGGIWVEFWTSFWGWTSLVCFMRFFAVGF